MTPFHATVATTGTDIEVLPLTKHPRSFRQTHLAIIHLMTDVAQSLTGWPSSDGEGNKVSSYFSSRWFGLGLSSRRYVTRRYVLAGFLLLALLPTAAQAQNNSREIERLELQYLTTRSAEQREDFVRDLRALAKRSKAADAGALNAAVSAMLTAANSAREAEELLEIGAANPTARPVDVASLPADTEFLMDVRHAAPSARQSNGDVEALADIRIDHLRKDSLGRDGLASAHIQQVWRINSVQGARSFSPRSVMYSGMSETLSMVRARVLKSDGREVDAAVSADHPVMERGSSMYFDSRSRDLRFRKLEPGDVVEIEYHLLPTAEVNPWADYYGRLDLFRDSFPTQLWRRVVIAPNTMKLYAVEHGVHPALVQKGAETIRIWEAREIGAQSFEALSTEAGTSRPYLHVSTIGSIEEFGRWYSELLEPGLKLDENLLNLAQQIVQRNLTTKGKVQAVYESVQHSTKYIGFEFGVHSFQPYPVSTVERRGFGDCKDMAAMIVALLRAVGVSAEFAMVRTRSAGAVVDEAYSLALFNHAMVYVPELNQYLDGTAGHAVLGELPPEDQGAMAMTVDAHGNATRRAVPFSTSGATRVTGDLRAEIDRNGKTQGITLATSAPLAYASIPELPMAEHPVPLPVQ
jgi:transglutaminase-like putative cysteine protease